jgi:hypothetical protein
MRLCSEARNTVTLMYISYETYVAILYPELWSLCTMSVSWAPKDFSVALLWAINTLCSIASFYAMKLCKELRLVLEAWLKETSWSSAWLESRRKIRDTSSSPLRILSVHRLRLIFSQISHYVECRSSETSSVICINYLIKVKQFLLWHDARKPK